MVMRNTKHIGLNLPISWITFLKKKNHQECIKNNSNTEYTSLIKRALIKEFPELKDEK